MIIVSHPTGNPFVRAVLSGLVAKEELEGFYTTINCNAVSGSLPASIREKLSRRCFPVVNQKIHTYPLRELARLIAPKVGLWQLTRHEKGWASVDSVYRDLDQHVAKELARSHAKSLAAGSGNTSGVYAYEDCSLATFQMAHKLGLKRFYDLPIAYWQTSRRLLEKEALRYPEWEPTLGATRDSSQKTERKTQELNLADVVICPSKFVFDSLPESIRNEKRCVIAEFGSPDLDAELPESELLEADLPAAQPLDCQPSGRLRVLFAGSLSQRKGLADLFQAVKTLGRSDVELVVMGSPVVSLDFYFSQLKSFTYEPPRPHSQVLKLMKTCDILVLPSIVEGRALVQQEAMICGLPIIVTANAGGADLVENGKTGYLVPIGSPDHLAEKIAWCADHRAEVKIMGQLARSKAMELTWTRYSSKIFDAILPSPDDAASSSSHDLAIADHER